MRVGLLLYRLQYAILTVGGEKMNREDLKEQIDELMRQYSEEEIDGATYAQKMMELTTTV